ncbi:POT family proton-dependent oligopeptide transporter [Stakelama pacifica]|uniref:POT family proton-dependent oligopeptide transporter n=2 Tax=Stakelama pacifica TaxID=517720 RepID=A0A4R6FL29_9SPHN|nr:POT family proton-dependent oligopeptide transporter [Stakelama pacifica]GGO95944.1 MFS transporter [Stakelama pacifica]
MASANPVPMTEKTFLGHPLGLIILFFAEMWERFSYYGMRALLIFYLTKHWLFSDSDASVIYGAYTSLVYITPVLGGWLADKYLGQRKAVMFGAVVLTLGHALMAFEGNGGQGDPTINIFWLALAFIIVGSGFLKGNISVIVGQLYPIKDVRRDGAYTIFYMGINLGSLIGVLITGYLGEHYGWSYGFGAAGIGMLLGLVVFVLGKPLLLGKGEPHNPALLKERVAGVPREWLVYLAGVAAIGVLWLLIQYQAVVGWLLGISGLALLGYIAFIAFTKLSKRERDRILVIIFLLVLQPVFWGLFEQAGASVNLYTDRYVDRMLFGWEVPATWFQSVNSAFILLFGPVFAWTWTSLGRRGLEPSTPAKFGIGIILVGLGFMALNWGAQAMGVDVQTSMWLIVLLYLLHTMGELSLSPVGLSAMNRLAPWHMAGLIMGGWFFATAGGNFVAGQISALAGADGAEGGEAAKELYLQVWNTVGWIAFGIGIAVLLVSPFIKKLQHLDTLEEDTDHAMAGESELAEPQAAGRDTWEETRR